MYFRWRSVETSQVYAVKRFTKARLAAEPSLFENEVNGLQHATAFRLCRVVDLHEVLYAGNGDAYLVLE